MPTYMPPTRSEQRWRALAYVLIAIVGVYALWMPTMFTVSRPVIVALWGGFMLMAVPAAAAVYTGRYRVEAVLLPLFTSALAVSAVTASIGLFNGLDATEMQLIPRVFTAASLVCLLALRMHQLNRILKAEPWITTDS
jgi:ribose/xylose/arabinose/galactoside ABC-type transport system permease subunit